MAKPKNIHSSAVYFAQEAYKTYLYNGTLHPCLHRHADQFTFDYFPGVQASWKAQEAMLYSDALPSGWTVVRLALNGSYRNAETMTQA